MLKNKTFQYAYVQVEEYIHPSDMKAMPVSEKLVRMPFLQQVTPLVITYNEEVNIGRTLNKLTWAKRIVVVDSHSNDKTLEIIRSFPQVDLYFRPFDTFAHQCNYGLSKIDTEWVLSLDADYVLSDTFIQEMNHLLNNSVYDGYFTDFKYCIYGSPLRADNTTPRQVLYRKELASYIDDGHQHRVQVRGQSGKFKSFIYHDDRKSIKRWLMSQDGYLQIEAQKIVNTPFRKLDAIDKLRKMIVISPIVVLLYCLFYKGLILDGWKGIFYSFQRTITELHYAIHIMDISKLQKEKNSISSSLNAISHKD